MAKEVKSIPGDPTQDILKRRISKAERDLAKLNLYREQDRSNAEVLRAQISNWREELRKVRNGDQTN